jgi:RNA polymerase sigma-70 factor (ECF subfamily)
MIRNADPDRPLIDRAKRELPYGTAAYEDLVKLHTAEVFRRAYGILRSAHDAEEATQDVWLAVFRNLPRFRFEKPFGHWLSTVTLNSCRMILRRRASEKRRRDAYEREAPSIPEPPQSRSGLRALLNDLLDQLDPGTRVPILMRFVEGYTYPEIAEQLELSESAVKMRVSRGSKQLRQLYEQRVATPSEKRGVRR